MELFWFVPIIVSILCVAAVVLLIFPLPVSIREKVIGFFYKLIYPLFIVILILLVVFIQEFTEQRKFTERRKNSQDGNRQFYVSEQFRHQRNMYLTLLSIVLVGIVCILSRVLNSFVSEYNFLKEQLNARIQIQNNSQANRPNNDGIERRNLPE